MGEIADSGTLNSRLAAEATVAFVRKELFDAESKILWRVYREGRG